MISLFKFGLLIGGSFIIREFISYVYFSYNNSKQFKLINPKLIKSIIDETHELIHINTNNKQKLIEQYNKISFHRKNIISTINLLLFNNNIIISPNIIQYEIVIAEYMSELQKQIKNIEIAELNYNINEITNSIKIIENSLNL